MDTGGTNLFIVDDNKLMLESLKLFLHERFGKGLTISTFIDGDSCLKKVDKDTDIVILDYHMEGKDGLEVLRSIKEINPKTEVIMLSSNEDVALAIETFRSGAKEYVVKGVGAWNKISKLVNYIITKPIRMMVREFGVSKFLAVFLFVFFVMGISVLIVSTIIK